MDEFSKQVHSELNEAPAQEMQRQNILKLTDELCDKNEKKIDKMTAKWTRQMEEFEAKLIPYKRLVEQFKADAITLKDKLDLQISDELCVNNAKANSKKFF